ncbi:histidinol dehydrogenase [Flavihumibacter petaseus]|uniref:Histidinol dehydrogenase n=1 Tax=Flavihumibacter petaseus NBRC 106054 TaxID=1220578 RepID=A0A0E9N0V8_9BACT|nr:histidinol dehydrogenase [Flavihumibacter petaseus]GAO43469.1 histidinol dehydrogenase [Flavihumibacter petaseus NBRC 106054]
MKLVKSPEKKDWPDIIRRPVMDTTALAEKVRTILNDLQRNGDAALRQYTRQFDGYEGTEIRVTPAEFATASGKLDPALKTAIRVAANNIRKFHEAQQQEPELIETMPGVRCWRAAVGIEKVGLYIPGGTAPLFSTLLMLGIPAIIAGCKEIILCSPPDAAGNLHPALLFAANEIGINKVFRAGGVQAIGAMAYGTETVPAVYKIFGPGNQYVTCAKQLVQQDGIAIDMPAGPSEVAVLADHTANAGYLAADLLSQAEHGADSQVLLVVTEEKLAQQVQQCLLNQLEKLPRRDLAEKALAASHLVVMPSKGLAMELLNAYAPEHLILATEDALALSREVVNAGSVFIGHFSPESVGDYASGTNHTLPTNGFARAYSGVSLDSFVKKITYQQLTSEGLRQIAPAVIAMARAEGLDAHANAVSIRLEKNQ